MLCGFSSDADDLNEEPVDAHGLQEMGHVLQVADIQTAYRIDEAHLKAFAQGLSDASDTLVVAAMAANAVIDILTRTVQTHTKIIQLLRRYLLQDSVKKETIGVHCNGSIAYLSGCADEKWEVGMEGGFAAYKDEIGRLCLIDEGLEPTCYGSQRKGFFTMLRRIDIAVSAPEVTAGEYMEEYVPCIFLEGNRLFHKNLQNLVSQKRFALLSPSHQTSKASRDRTTG